VKFYRLSVYSDDCLLILETKKKSGIPKEGSQSKIKTIIHFKMKKVTSYVTNRDYVRNICKRWIFYFNVIFLSILAIRCSCLAHWKSVSAWHSHCMYDQSRFH